MGWHARMLSFFLVLARNPRQELIARICVCVYHYMWTSKQGLHACITFCLQIVQLFPSPVRFCTQLTCLLHTGHCFLGLWRHIVASPSLFSVLSTAMMKVLSDEGKKK